MSLKPYETEAVVVKKSVKQKKNKYKIKTFREKRFWTIRGRRLADRAISVPNKFIYVGRPLSHIAAAAPPVADHKKYFICLMEEVYARAAHHNGEYGRLK